MTRATSQARERGRGIREGRIKVTKSDMILTRALALHHERRALPRHRHHHLGGRRETRTRGGRRRGTEVITGPAVTRESSHQATAPSLDGAVEEKAMVT